MFNVILKDEVLDDLLAKHSKIISIMLEKNIYSYEDDDECKVLFNECVERICSLGLHYGHYVRSRKCDNRFLKGTRYSVSLINMNKSYSNLLYFLMLMYKSIKENSNILFISKKPFSFLKNDKLKNRNICEIDKWMGGTLTNSKYVLKGYKKKLYDHSYGYISLICLLNPKNSRVLSREVKAYNEMHEKKVILGLISDTNMSFVTSHQITPILMNDESPYFKKFMNSVMSCLIDLL